MCLLGLLASELACGDDDRRELGASSGLETGDGDDGTGTSDPGEGGDGDGDPSGDGDGDGDGDPSGDGDGDGGCGDGVVGGEEICDDGINDGAYGGCLPDCSGLGPSCGDGMINGSEQCDDANSGTSDGCLGDCKIPRSCREILEYDPNASDGVYVVAPKSPELGFTTNCDMTTDGGGWTEVTLPHLCNGDLDTQLMAIESASAEGIDPMCRPYTRDGGGDHTYVFDLTFPPGFESFYLSAYVIKANAGGGDQASIEPLDFVQTSWQSAHGVMVSVGDVSFGSADDAGPVTSYAALLIDPVSCQSCEIALPIDPAGPYALGSATTLFRLGWGEAGGQSEGWYPWWSGSVYLR